MSRLCLVIALILATASAQPVKDRDDVYLWRKCYNDIYPYTQCYPTCAEYPLISDIFDSEYNYASVQRMLDRDNALKKLCGEASKYVGCVSNALERAPKGCDKHYERHRYIYKEDFDKYSNLLVVICTDDFIKKVRRNLDCVGQADWNFFGDARDCRFADLSRNCSGLVDHDAWQRCDTEKYRRNCDADAVVQCAAEFMGNRCGKEVAEMVTFVGNAYYERFSVCPGPRDNGRDFNRLLKFFKI